ncbi:hypothetical protein WI41_22855 [Burkholderia latens]|uniref:Uncharacterized protein n=1 Tax=Burkholderia latens TaxID=488446 RepID=A0AAP1C2C4_9BURK|nr:hypothetical protein WI41_22855 [Burkholderia latens]
MGYVPAFDDHAVLHAEEIDERIAALARPIGYMREQPDEIALGRTTENSRGFRGLFERADERRDRPA